MLCAHLAACRRAWRGVEFGCSERPPHLFALCAKVLLMWMHRPRHEALSASSLGGKRVAARRAGMTFEIASRSSSPRSGVLWR